MELPVWEEHGQSSNCTQINVKQLWFVRSRRAAAWILWESGTGCLARWGSGKASPRWCWACSWEVRLKREDKVVPRAEGATYAVDPELADLQSIEALRLELDGEKSRERRKR